MLGGRVFDLAPEGDGIRIGRDRVDREIQMAGALVGSAVWQAQANDRGVEAAARRIAVAQRQSLTNRYGKVTYIGSWLTMVVSTPEDGLTTLPSVTAVRPILPSMGDVMSV